MKSLKKSNFRSGKQLKSKRKKLKGGGNYTNLELAKMLLDTQDKIDDLVNLYYDPVVEGEGFGFLPDIKDRVIQAVGSGSDRNFDPQGINNDYYYDNYYLNNPDKIYAKPYNASNGEDEVGRTKITRSKKEKGKRRGRRGSISSSSKVKIKKKPFDGITWPEEPNIYEIEF
tara:strand:+ start:99 stop:611 length:513 start_codon:yes stop_codon:yes gene_type:complete